MKIIFLFLVAAALASPIPCDSLIDLWAWHPKFSGLTIPEPNDFACFSQDSTYAAFQKQLSKAIIFNSSLSISCQFYREELNFICRLIDQNDIDFYAKMKPSYVHELYEKYSTGGKPSTP